MKKTLLAIAAAALTLPLAAPAAADPPPWAPAHGWREKHRYDDRGYRQQRYDSRYYYSDGRYRQPRRITRNDYVWRGDDGRYYCRRGNGTTGLIIGAGAGALAGRAIDNRGDRTLGTVLGGVIGGLLGREIDRGGLQCR
ncbi:MAG: glycine zipper 2TM domain-containing protein [Tsuneonella sp.]